MREQKLFDTMETVFFYSNPERKCAVELIKYIYKLKGENIYYTIPRNFIEFQICRMVLQDHMTSELNEALSKCSPVWKRLLSNWNEIERLYKEHEKFREVAIHDYLKLRVNHLIEGK